MMAVKEEAPEYHRSCADLHDPKLHHLEGKQDGVCISLGAAQEINAIRFPVTGTPIQSENDKQPPLLSQFYQDQIKGSELPEENNGRIYITRQNRGDGSISIGAEDEEEDDDVDRPNACKGSKALESDRNSVRKPVSSSESTDHFVHGRAPQKHVTHSEMESSTSEVNACFTEKKNVDSQRKVQTGVRISCEDHGKTFTGRKKTTLNIHKRIHTGQKPFSCDLCGKKFGYKSRLNQHTMIHTGQKLSCCDLCEKGFCDQSNLNTHMIVHTGQKPFFCDQCGKRFGHSVGLKTHMRIHTGENHFYCDVCEQAFTEKASLNKLMFIHTGQKPYFCDQCGKRFGYRVCLKTHMRIHMGKKLFWCDLCGNRYSHKSSLNIHMRIHTGEKPFYYDVCGQRFTQKSNLNKHMMRIPTGKETISV